MKQSLLLRSLLLTTASPLFIYAGCRQPGTAAPPDCGSVICTMEYRTITISVADATGGSAVLDNWYTLAPDGRRIKGDKAGNGYVVLGDDFRKELAGTTRTFTFVAEQSGSKAGVAKFEISADCCHVSKVSGPEAMTLP